MTQASTDFVLGLVEGTLLLGQYRVHHVLGKPGGFGITYLAEDINLSRRVALKEFLPRDLAGRSTDRTTVLPHSDRERNLFEYGLERFTEEGRLLAMLDDHPNIVRVRSAFQANGTAYLVMNYYEGESLAEFCERSGGRLSAPEAVAIVKQVLNGLVAAHAHGILHRDVKPENIYLRQREGQPPQALLLDFGAARQAVKDRSQGVTAMLSAGYAPLEQYSRNGAQGPWTDVYACAAVLYELIAGFTPPEAPERIEADTLVPPHELQKSCPKALSAAIVNGLSMRRQDRPQTAEAFLEALDDVRVTPSSVPRIRPIAAAAAIVVLAGAGFLAAQLMGDDPDPVSQEPTESVEPAIQSPATPAAAADPVLRPPQSRVEPRREQPTPQKEVVAKRPQTRQQATPEKAATPTSDPPASVAKPEPVPPPVPTAGELQRLTAALSLADFNLRRNEFNDVDAGLGPALSTVAALRLRYPAADTLRALEGSLRRLRAQNVDLCRKIAQVVSTQKCPSGE